MSETPHVYPTQPKRLVRSKDDRMIGGVCGGSPATSASTQASSGSPS